MCVIISNENGAVIDPAIISSSMQLNPDGFGFYDINADKVTRSMDSMIAYDLMDTGNPYIAHFRYATKGGVDINNVHPSEVGDYLLFQNGTVKGLADSEANDTRQIAEMLQYVRKSDLSRFLSGFQSRFVLVDRKKGDIHYTGGWYKDSNIWYSKQDVLDNAMTYRHFDSDDESQVHTVGVYGTLKYGYHNHRLLEGSTFIGYFETKDRYRLCIDGLPYLIDGPCDHGHHVDVELYAVNRETLERLDQLEGHPDWYCRREIQCFDNGGKVTAWVYMAPDSYDDGEYHISYEG